MTSMRRNDVASTSFRRHVPTRFIINQCQIITFLILKSDITENSRIEIRGIALPVPANQIKVTFIIILPFNFIHLRFLPVSHRNWRKRPVDYWGVGGGQRVCWPPPKLLGGGWPPPLAPLFLRLCCKFKLVTGTLQNYNCGRQVHVLAHQQRFCRCSQFLTVQNHL